MSTTTTLLLLLLCGAARAITCEECKKEFRDFSTGLNSTNSAKMQEQFCDGSNEWSKHICEDGFRKAALNDKVVAWIKIVDPNMPCMGEWTAADGSPTHGPCGCPLKAPTVCKASAKEYKSTCIPPEVAKEMPGAKQNGQAVTSPTGNMVLIDLAQHTRNFRHRAQQQIYLTAVVQVFNGGGSCSRDESLPTCHKSTPQVCVDKKILCTCTSISKSDICEIDMCCYEGSNPGCRKDDSFGTNFGRSKRTEALLAQQQVGSAVLALRENFINMNPDRARIEAREKFLKEGTAAYQANANEQQAMRDLEAEFKEVVQRVKDEINTQHHGPEDKEQLQAYHNQLQGRLAYYVNHKTISNACSRLFDSVTYMPNEYRKYCSRYGLVGPGSLWTNSS